MWNCVEMSRIGHRSVAVCNCGVTVCICSGGREGKCPSGAFRVSL